MMLLVIGGILLIIAGTGSWLWGRYIAEVDLAARRECPEGWYVAPMPAELNLNSLEQANETGRGQYFVVDGDRVEYENMDVEWVKDNCPIDPPTQD
jgi:purine nucleoside permease